jgi:hypothetical protein
MSHVGYVLIKVSIGQEKAIKDELLKIKGILRADITSGPYDMIAVIEDKDINAILDKVIKEVRTLPQIFSTQTLLSKETTRSTLAGLEKIKKEKPEPKKESMQKKREWKREEKKRREKEAGEAEELVEEEIEEEKPEETKVKLQPEKKYLTKRQISRGLKDLKTQLTPGEIDELYLRLEGTEVTQQQLDEIKTAIRNRKQMDSKELENKVKALEEKTKQAEKLLKESPEKVTADMLKSLRGSISKALTEIRENAHLSQDELKRMEKEIETIRSKTESLFGARLEEVEKKATELSSIVHKLSGDIEMVFGEANLKKYIKDTTQRILKKK